MTPRENLLALLKGETFDEVPIWLMGFDNEDTARRLNPGKDFPHNLSANPETKDYPWDRISDEERTRTLIYNETIMKPTVVAGWGANMALGHGGPGEFHFSLIEINGDERVLLCETGAKRVVRKNPHFYKDFDYPLSTIDMVDKLILPDPKDPERHKGFESDVDFFKKSGYLVSANLNGFFSGPHYFCIDYQEFLMSMLLDPVNTKKLIDKIGEWNISAAEELLKRGTECIILCDDLGSSDNMLMSPELYEQWILPWHKKLCDLAHDFGAFVHLHSHGNINKILPLVLSAGVDMLNPFDIYESMDLISFLENKKDCRTVPVGGCHKFFFQWDEKEQSEYLTKLFSGAKRKGRWIFMETGGVPEIITMKNYNFVMDTLAKLKKL